MLIKKQKITKEEFLEGTKELMETIDAKLGNGGEIDPEAAGDEEMEEDDG
jgi:hypothetical protein